MDDQSTAVIKVNKIGVLIAENKGLNVNHVRFKI